MTQFHLKIVTPDGERFDGMAESISLRTVSGDMGILANHIDCAFTCVDVVDTAYGVVGALLKFNCAIGCA